MEIGVYDKPDRVLLTPLTQTEEIGWTDGRVVEIGDATNVQCPSAPPRSILLPPRPASSSATSSDAPSIWRPGTTAAAEREICVGSSSIVPKPYSTSIMNRCSASRLVVPPAAVRRALVALAVVIVAFSSVLGKALEAQEAEPETLDFRNTLTVSIGRGRSITEGTEIVAALGGDYLYRLSKRWEIGIAVDWNFTEGYEEFEGFAVEPL